ncbi:MAG: hypothetical protein J5472_05875 [Clostridia bacterium]|nr:hypothetical protein [Clostridia bacterium]MCR4887309.1 hypothetical protein [Clostridiales bacterium]
MSEDISKYAEQVVSKLTGNSEMISKFKSDPTKTVTDLLGIKLDDNIVQSIIKLVVSKLNLGDLTKKGGLLDKIKKFLGLGK